MRWRRQLDRLEQLVGYLAHLDQNLLVDKFAIFCPFVAATRVVVVVGGGGGGGFDVIGANVARSVNVVDVVHVIGCDRIDRIIRMAMADDAGFRAIGDGR